MYPRHGMIANFIETCCEIGHLQGLSAEEGKAAFSAAARMMQWMDSHPADTPEQTFELAGLLYSWIEEEINATPTSEE